MTDDGGQPWAVLAFDHRERAFSSVRPGGMEPDQIRQAKQLIFDAFLLAVERGLGDVRPGILVDEEFGADIARAASERGFAVSMPVERAFEEVLTFEYGDAFREHLLEFRPTWAKVLVHHRTGDEPDAKQLQLERMRELSDFLAEESIGLMLELIVGQTSDGERGVPSVDTSELCASMAEIQDAGVRVDLWKVEGISSREAAARVAARAADAGHPATCVVLGAGAPTDVVGHWLDVASATSGFSGFAIGRSIWGAPVTAWLDGRLSRDDAVEQVASTYRSCALRYSGVRVG